MFARKVFGLSLVSILAATASCTTDRTAQSGVSPRIGTHDVRDLEVRCQPAAVQAVASKLSTAVTVKQIPNGPVFPGGTKYFPATDKLPAFCQVTGSFVTNPATGKTANFLATLPANWNGNFLQLGCSGHCGMIAVQDPASLVVPIAAQGKPGDIIARGYASFGTDQGHLMGNPRWELNPDGSVNRDAVDDLLYRSNQVLARMGKEFTRAFYAQAKGRVTSLRRSYFAGCSEGGRDALVAASYFPEEFDGIVAGSPYAHMAGVSFHGAAVAMAGSKTPDAGVSPGLMRTIDPIVKARCDRLDGVEDGLIQNPAACNFRPERDLPRCQPNAAGNQCFTEAQIATINTVITAVTDENGAVLQPGMSASEIQTGASSRSAAQGEDPVERGLPFSVLKYFASNNDPNYHVRDHIALRHGGSEGVGPQHTVVSRAEFDRVTQATRPGIGVIAENADRLMRGRTRLLIWSNLSDQALTPYMALNYYNRLASRFGGFERLQRQVRLFGLPGTSHCSMGGPGPGSFDALGAMEAWVERGVAPNGLLASLYSSRPNPASPQPFFDYARPPLRTMRLCMYPQMARYSGKGNVNDATNWKCPANDRSMLKVGESGRRTGVMTYGDR